MSPRRFPILDGQRVVFAGDSITDADRAFEPPLGRGWVRRFSELVLFHHPERDITWVNRGVGGDVARDLRLRWDRDVLGERPDWLVLMIGINDCVGLMGYPAEEVLAAYRSELGWMLEAARSHRPRLVLLDPFYVATPAGPWAASPDQLAVLRRLVRYQRVVAELAQRHRALHLRTQHAFARVMAHRAPGLLAPEPVHPHPAGHALIAQALYELLATGR